MISELGVGVLKDAVVGPHQVPSVGVFSDYPSAMGYNLLAS